MWSETSRGVGGRVAGSVSGAQINALIESSGFSADLSLMTTGNRQVVSLRPRGIDVNDVSVTLNRSK
jgi:predicted methyltransferase MtxX (methanogen marker protein 4)